MPEYFTPMTATGATYTTAADRSLAGRQDPAWAMQQQTPYSRGLPPPPTPIPQMSYQSTPRLQSYSGGGGSPGVAFQTPSSAASGALAGSAGSGTSMAPFTRTLAERDVSRTRRADQRAEAHRQVDNDMARRGLAQTTIAAKMHSDVNKRFDDAEADEERTLQGGMTDWEAMLGIQREGWGREDTRFDRQLSAQERLADISGRNELAIAEANNRAAVDRANAEIAARNAEAMRQYQLSLRGGAGGAGGQVVADQTFSGPINFLSRGGQLPWGQDPRAALNAGGLGVFAGGGGLPGGAVGGGGGGGGMVPPDAGSVGGPTQAQAAQAPRPGEAVVHAIGPSGAMTTWFVSQGQNGLPVYRQSGTFAVRNTPPPGMIPVGEDTTPPRVVVDQPGLPPGYGE